MRASVDLAVVVGSVALPNPVMTASGTAGHGAELSAYFDLSTIGAVVVKSLSAEAWAGNPAPRVHEVEAGMLNSVGLQNPGVEAWLADELPPLVATGARVVASIWGTTVAAYEKAAAALAASAPEAVVAVEVNLSCPNLEGRSCPCRIQRRRLDDMVAHPRRIVARDEPHVRVPGHDGGRDWRSAGSRHGSGARCSSASRWPPS